MNWITKIIKAGEKIKTAIRDRATKEDIAKSDWTSCCRGPILKTVLEKNLWVCPDCNKHHRIKPKQRFDILFGKNNYEVFKTPIPKDDPLNWTDSKSFFRIGPRQQLVHSLFAISSLVARSRIAVFIFSPALIILVIQFIEFFFLIF